MDLSRRAVLGAPGAAALSRLVLPFRPRAEDLIVPSKIEAFATTPDGRMFASAEGHDQGPEIYSLTIPEGGFFQIHPIRGINAINIEHAGKLCLIRMFVPPAELSLPRLREWCGHQL